MRNPAKTRKCAWCGEPFEPKTSRNRYRCRACGKKGNAKDTLRHNRERVRALLGKRRCDYCGKEYEPKRADSKTCSKECRRALSWREFKERMAEGKVADRRDPGKTRTCRLCGREFVPRHAAQRYCGDECRTAYRTMEYRATVEERHVAQTTKKPTVERRCSYCGTVYMAYSGRSRFCSPECAAMADADSAERGREARKAVCLVCGAEFVRYTARNIFCSRKCAKRASYCRSRIEGGHHVPDGKRFMRADEMLAARNAANEKEAKVRISRAFMVSDDRAVASGARDERMASECERIAAMPEEDE